MAKTITIRDPMTQIDYTLEFTRKSVQQMEASGFVLDDMLKKPNLMLPMLFAGAFAAHHKVVKPDTIDRIFRSIGDKERLIPALVEMYDEPLTSLMEDADTGDEGNPGWTANW